MKVIRKTSTLGFQVQEALKQEIISGRLKPGQRLLEQDLCERLDVSRTSLRESLRYLEADGLVEIIPHRGAVVASIETSEICQIYQVRGALEALATRNFSLNSTDRQVEALKAVVEELNLAASEERSTQDLREIKEKFYTILLSPENNQTIKELLDRLNNRISMFRTLSMGRPGRMKQTIGELFEIVDAIENRDPDLASRAALNHINNAESNLLELLSQEKESATI